MDESFSLTANLKQTFRELEWLKRPFRRVNVLMADKRFTFTGSCNGPRAVQETPVSYLSVCEMPCCGESGHGLSDKRS